MKTIINKILPMTFIDGPNNRMAVFLQGCNMYCLYCHNPETQNYCNGCGVCLSYCKTGALHLKNGSISWERKLCENCDLCIHHCPHNASPKTIEMDSDELYRLIKRDEDFIDGITFSGGECTLQSLFILEVSQKLKKNTSLTIFLDTNGFMNSEILRKLCSMVDGFMFDLKAFDDGKHKALTTMSNNKIFKNMAYTSSKGLLYEIRTVILQGYNDNEKEIEEIAHFIKSLNKYTKLKLIPFRPQGVNTILKERAPFPREKYEKLVQIAEKILYQRVESIPIY